MASYPLVAVAICELTVISHFIHTLFWAQMQENASIPFFFHILTSPLNSIYLCSLWGLFYSGWKKKLIFVPSLLPYGSPSPLLFPAPSANPIVSPSPLLSSAFLSFFLFSSLLHYCPISFSTFPNPHLPSYPLFSLTPPPLTKGPLSSSPPLCSPLPFFALIPPAVLSSYFFSSLCSSFTPFPSSSISLLISPLLPCSCIPLHPLHAHASAAVHIFPLSLSSHPPPPTLPPLSTFYFSTSLVWLSLLSQSDVPKRRSGETKSRQSPGICPAGPFRLLIYSFVCVPPSLPSLSLRLWCVSNCPPRLACQHTHTRTHTCMHTQALIATWRSVKLQPHQHCCEGIAVCSARRLLSSPPLPLFFLLYLRRSSSPLWASSLLTCCFPLATLFPFAFSISVSLLSIHLLHLIRCATHLSSWAAWRRTYYLVDIILSGPLTDVVPLLILQRWSTSSHFLSSKQSHVSWLLSFSKSISSYSLTPLSVSHSRLPPHL